MMSSTSSHPTSSSAATTTTTTTTTPTTPHVMPSLPAGATTAATAAAANAQSSSMTVPPIVHAVGGSIGSTLSLLLLYPLERARIEMQAQQASTVSHTALSSRRGSDRDNGIETEIGTGNVDLDDIISNDVNMDENINDDDDVMSPYDQNRIMANMDYFNDDDDVLKQSVKDDEGVEEGEIEGRNTIKLEEQQKVHVQVQQEDSQPLRNTQKDTSDSPPPPSTSSDEFSFEMLNSKTSENSHKNDTNNCSIAGDSISKCSNSTDNKSGDISGGTEYNNNSNSSNIPQQPQIRGGTIQIKKPISNTIKKSTFVPQGLTKTTETTSQQLPSSSTSTSSPSSIKVSSIQDKQGQKVIARNDNQKAKDGLYVTIQKLHKRKELYKGVTPVVTTLAISNFIFFYALQATKKLLFKYHSTNGRTKNASLLASSIAGILNVLITNPLWMANLRIIQSKDDDYDDDDECIIDGGDNSGSDLQSVQSRRKRMNLWRMLCYIAKKEGVKQLWNGTWASLILVSNPAIQYYVYERCKDEIISYRKKKLSLLHGLTGSISSRTIDDAIASTTLQPIDAFILGALAKGIATVLTYPLQLAQVLIRLQTNHVSTTTCKKEETMKKDDNITSQEDEGQQKASEDEKNEISNEECTSPQFNGTFHCMIQLYKQGGIKALYAGMDAKLVQTVLTSALTFLTYEQIISLVAKSYISFWSSSSSSKPN